METLALSAQFFYKSKTSLKNSLLINVLKEVGYSSSAFEGLHPWS